MNITPNVLRPTSRVRAATFVQPPPSPTTLAQEITSLADDCRECAYEAHGVYLMTAGAGLDIPSAADHLVPISNAAAEVYAFLKSLTETLTAVAERAER